MRCVFVNIRCKPGQSYRVAEAIALREIHSELYSTSGPFDLLLKLYIPEDADIGKYINDNLLDIDEDIFRQDLFSTEARPALLPEQWSLVRDPFGSSQPMVKQL